MCSCLKWFIWMSGEKKTFKEKTKIVSAQWINFGKVTEFDFPLIWRLFRLTLFQIKFEKTELRFIQIRKMKETFFFLFKHAIVFFLIWFCVLKRENIRNTENLCFINLNSQIQAERFKTHCISQISKKILSKYS